MVHIGKHWRPTWFRRRHGDGTYEALRAPMSAQELMLQQALLPEPPRLPVRWSLATAGMWVTAGIALVAAAAIAWPA